MINQLGKTSVGQAGKQARDRLSDAAEDMRERWETSQNP